MRLTIIKGFLPWLFFFSFADGSVPGLWMGSLGALSCLFLFNRGSLRNKIILDWIALLFFVCVPILSLWSTIIAQHGLFLANVVLAGTCFLSLVINKPVTQSYARLIVDQAYWCQELFKKVHEWLTLFWGMTFLVSSLTIGLYFWFQSGTLLWMVKIVPTASLVVVLGLTLLFPDLYRNRLIKRCGGVISLTSLSPLQFIVFESGRLSYRTIGKGPAVILLPDLYCTMLLWDVDFLKRLATHFQLVLVDYPGLGSSTVDQKSYSLEVLTHIIQRLVRQVKPIALLGVGMGGFIAQSLVRYHHFKERLVLINTDGGGHQTVRTKEDIRATWRNCFNDVQGWSREGALALLFPMSVMRRFKEKMEILWRANLLENVFLKETFVLQDQLIKHWYEDDKAYQPSDLSVLCIVGDQDQLIPAQKCPIFSKAQVIHYPDAGHGVIYQYPVALADQIIQFLKAHE